MNKDSKVLLVALFIIMVGAISFNYANITGKTISDYTEMTVSPKLVKAGESIYITVKPGKQGVHQDVEFYRTDLDLRVGYVAKVCKEANCFEKTTVKYDLSDTWGDNAEWDYDVISKDYYAKVYDIYSGQWVKSYFSVERKYEAAGPAEHL